MILKKEIAEKAVLWGVPSDTVDKDWVLGHFLVAFFQVDKHKEKLVFKGGTCLRKCRFPNYRFSEDLDFTSSDQEYKLTRELIKEAIQIANERSGVQFHLTELNDLVYKDKLVGYQAKIKYWGANHGKNQIPSAPERWLTSIKVEITLYEQMEFPAENYSIHHPYSDNDFITQEEIPCYDLKEVMAEKIRSLVQRSYTAPRDIYDIWFLKDQFDDTEWIAIKQAFLKKMKFKEHDYKGIDQLINERSIDILNRSWKQSLGNQLHLSSLPDIDKVITDLTETFNKHLA
jgi:predicted nucleotidyltransferase component of viral defense system